MGMKWVSKRMRIAIVISIFWLLVGTFLFGLAGEEIGGALLLAIIPLLLVWCLWWMVKRLKHTKTDKVKDENVTIDSVTKKIRALEAKVHKIESKLSELEKTK
jgi:type VI protein secretion system component VasK